ncbi:membrane dipeptidase [Paenibacillus chitinolyticus]
MIIAQSLSLVFPNFLIHADEVFAHAHDQLDGFICIPSLGKSTDHLMYHALSFTTSKSLRDTSTRASGQSYFMNGDSYDKSDLEHLVNHVDHVAALVGVEHIGIGLDIIEPFMKYDSPIALAEASRKDFDVVKGHSRVPELVSALAKRGYSDEATRLIMGKNFIRVYKEVWK